MPPNQRFADGEEILCFHGSLLYKAKCLKSIVTVENLVEYYVHYTGWNKKWDEWVLENRVLKYNEANIAKQDEIQAAVTAEIKAKKGRGRKSDKGTTSPATATVTEASDNGKRTLAVVASTDSVSEPTKRKRGRPDPNVENEEQYLVQIDKILLPHVLNSWLVDDWYKITTQFQLVDLPTKVSVDRIIEKYLIHKKDINNNVYGSLDGQLIEGLKEYFNMTLEPHLLYNLELPQYENMKYEYELISMSSIYGATHLLRLLSKLEVLLTYTPLGEKSIPIIKSAVQDFLKYFVQNSSSFFHSQRYIRISDQ